ncbi:uncharacterized protein I303_100864 [Kwoniella dejecticola CBS 10117]|uniref:CBM21 domain-containing protein n=1 Tax=Kwoniella dejecticola CBS 10117 TaxID=1296121 RepID=A0A1A6AG41_9TREE|nr:uncharacterized protein I303_00867 [Kwoniella dejecticola CBS 10117]OBR89045.1 hypothetical protein I303_00867 [Kwoniella dejecticola CBS 10117]
MTNSAFATVDSCVPVTSQHQHDKPTTSTNIQAEAFYPTPPPSPVIEDLATLPDKADTYLVIDKSPTPVVPLVSVPIPLFLDTQHHLPHASGLRLASPSSLLATLGGNRVLALDPSSSVWDRMPYSASTPLVSTPNAMEEDSVESLVGGEKPQPSMNGIHWAMRKQKSTEHISSIFVSPPTPERIVSPTSEQAPTSSLSAFITPSSFPTKTAESRSSASPSGSREVSPAASPAISTKTLPVVTSPIAATIPLQTLPEVRSPPKKTIAMTTDSLQLSAKRGRRPRLFGFTEMVDGANASASSSAASSAANSPDRTPPIPSKRFDYHTSTASETGNPGPSNTSSPTNFMPRRHPVRARSEAALMHTIHHIPPRRRENGLKLNFDGIVPLPQPQEIQSATIPSPYTSRLIRKKSGEILKSALKYGGPLLPNGTPIHDRETLSQSPRFESKSCPSTPSCPKYVHFDAQLERVKLFLHDQKPQVVSRDGSPTADTTSEGDEFPFPSSTDEEREVKKVLTVSLPNFPTSHPPDSELYLESLFLEEDRKALKGVVVCANISFQKWVAIRFTFDWWQTTSEVTATYKESIKGGKYDRFTFSIKLNDILAKIEEKTLFMAIRYNADGREIWDSNGGQNYQVLFQKVARQVVGPGIRAARNSISLQPGMGKAVGGRTSQWSVSGASNDDRLADLRAKLDRLTADEPDRIPVSPNSTRHFSFDFGRKGSDRSSPSGSPKRGFASIDTKTSDLPAAGPALAARYDFGASLKTTARRGSNSPLGRPGELPDVKTGLLSYSNGSSTSNTGSTRSNGHAAMEFYSPKFNQATLSTNDYFFSPTSTTSATMPMSAPVPDLKVQGPSPPALEEKDSTPTPTQSQPKTFVPTYTVPPPKPPSPQRPSHSFKRQSTYTPRFTIGDDSVEVSPNVSPPQLIPSSSTESNATDTPSESPRSPPDLSLAKWSPTARSADSSDDVNSLSSYSSFIEQFCWGGNGNGNGNHALTPERRSHSASSLDNYFSPIETSGVVTPRALANTPQGRPIGSGNAQDTPSSTTSSSYYSTYSSTPTTREDLDSVEKALNVHVSPSGRIHVGGHMSPPVMA